MVTLIHYTNYDVNPLNNLEDIKQNHCHTVSLYVNMTFRHQIVDKTTGL